MEVLGIDIGGSGIKGAIVNIETGEFVGERHRIPTPNPATPEAIALTIKEIADHFDYHGKIGCGFPSLMNNGVIKSATNIDKSCMDVNANKLFSKITKRKVKVWNDADVAGYAELKFGNENKNAKMAMFLTIGTGIGSALVYKDKLIPSTEFGHIFMNNGLIAEKYTSDAVRKKEELSWEDWGKRFNEYLLYLEKLFSPDVFILGGGTSKKFDKFKDEFTTNAPVLPATLLNKAGIIGAALLTQK